MFRMNLNNAAYNENEAVNSAAFVARCTVAKSQICTIVLQAINFSRNNYHIQGTKKILFRHFPIAIMNALPRPYQRRILKWHFIHSFGPVSWHLAISWKKYAFRFHTDKPDINNTIAMHSHRWKHKTTIKSLIKLTHRKRNIAHQRLNRVFDIIQYTQQLNQVKYK